MLYDPKWEQQTKADPFTLESLIAWLKTKKPSTSYDYQCNGRCLLSQYFASAGFENVHMFTTGFWAGDTSCPSSVGEEEARHRGRLIPMIPAFDRIAVGDPRTFGAALKRARSMPSPNQTK